MAKSNLHQGYNTLLTAKSFVLLDPDTKGATNANGTKTIEEELAELKGVPLFNEEEFSSRESKKQRQVLTDETIRDFNEGDTYPVIAKRGSNFVVVRVPKGETLDYEKEGLESLDNDVS
jgi:hypothetical protein